MSQPFAWPLAFPQAAEILERQLDRFVEYAGNLDTFEDRAVVLGMMPCLRTVQHYIEAALYTQAAAKAGFRFREAAPEVSVLMGEATADTVPLRTTFRLPRPPRFLQLRNIKQTIARCGLRTVRAFGPDVPVIISDSHLLNRRIREQRQPIRFRYPNEFFAGPAAEPGRGAYRISIETLLVDVVDLLSDIAELDDDYRSRLRTLVEPECRDALQVSARELNRLSLRKDIPRRLWSGTGGNVMARLLGLEVMRRGGTVKRHGHGVGAALALQNSGPILLIELMVATEFNVAVPGYADITDEGKVFERIPKERVASVTAGPMAPAAAIQPSRRTASTGGRRKVLYAPTLFRGLYQYLSPDLPDPVYLDWQKRLVSQLQALPIDLVCKTHPLLLPTLDQHPLADLIPLSRTPFEILLEEADVVLLDYFKTSTFAQAAATNLPMVLLDLNRQTFRPEFEVALQQRCHVLRADYDERNCPNIDPEALRAAILDGRGPRPGDSLLARFFATS